MKEQTVKIRDGQLQNHNIKLQEEFVKNNKLHGDYHNALEQIEHLELINKEICNEHDDKIAAMGKDMGKVIRNFEDLQGKYRRKKLHYTNGNLCKLEMVRKKKHFLKQKLQQHYK